MFTIVTSVEWKLQLSLYSMKTLVISCCVCVSIRVGHVWQDQHFPAWSFWHDAIFTCWRKTLHWGEAQITRDSEEDINWERNQNKKSVFHVFGKRIYSVFHSHLLWGGCLDTFHEVMFVLSDHSGYCRPSKSNSDIFKNLWFFLSYSSISSFRHFCDQQFLSDQKFFKFIQ